MTLAVTPISMFFPFTGNSNKKRVAKRTSSVRLHSYALPVLVFIFGDKDLLLFESGVFEPGERLRRRITPFRNEDDEGKRIDGLGQNVLQVIHHRAHQFLAERRVG